MMTQCSGCVGIGYVNKSPELTETLPIKAAFRSGIILILGRRYNDRSVAYTLSFMRSYSPIGQSHQTESARSIPLPSFRGSDGFADSLWR